MNSEITKTNHQGIRYKRLQVVARAIKILTFSMLGMTILVSCTRSRNHTLEVLEPDDPVVSELVWVYVTSDQYSGPITTIQNNDEMRLVRKASGLFDVFKGEEFVVEAKYFPNDNGVYIYQYSVSGAYGLESGYVGHHFIPADSVCEIPSNYFGDYQGTVRINTPMQNATFQGISSLSVIDVAPYCYAELGIPMSDTVDAVWLEGGNFSHFTIENDSLVYWRDPHYSYRFGSSGYYIEFRGKKLD